MKKETKSLLLIFLLLITGTVLVIFYNLYLQNKKIETSASVAIQERIEENIYRIGNILIDKNKEEIRFSGRVVKNSDWVQFLIYVAGYKWLQDESAIISDTRLKDLQLSLALLDWKYWDEFYYMKKGEEIDYDPGGIELLLQWKVDNKPITIKARETIIIRDAQDNIKLSGLIFLGYPLFDPIVLDSKSSANCIDCPYFQVEEKILRQLFKRKSGESGYEINTEIMPLLNSEIDIVIKKIKIP